MLLPGFVLIGRAVVMLVLGRLLVIGVLVVLMRGLVVSLVVVLSVVSGSRVVRFAGRTPLGMVILRR
ncbi:hypothetical protein GCM10010251_49570 [Streptomyces aurantiogriseus]|uniref:Uncharacterized protein n=1 Tax=Streptomyces aurantiogriseus TaxID=66870 RepID=A0A918CKE5_9ACTN|nr:hypothetical protein GCM10010251_49570 [Streptomyces aurantiogriseus]